MIIRTTRLPDNVRVITLRRPDAYALRRYETYADSGAGRPPPSHADFATEAAALLHHERLARDLDR